MTGELWNKLLEIGMPKDYLQKAFNVAEAAEQEGEKKGWISAIDCFEKLENRCQEENHTCDHMTDGVGCFECIIGTMRKKYE